MNDHSHETDDVLTALWEDVASSEGAARAHALCHLGEYFFHAGDIDDALAAADAAKDLFLAADEIDEAAHCDHNAAVALHVLGRFDEAVARHEDAVAGHMGGEWTRAAACCRIHLAGLYEEAGHLADARTQLRAASEELEQMGHVGLQGEAMLARSRVAWKRGRFAAALAAASKALPLLEAASPR
jgi:tetratricopeptide (TPR) repeat protein